MSSASDGAIFAVILTLRLTVPLLVFRYPLPSILASLVLDAADQSVFQQFTTLDLSSYQSYDKALDVYYLALAYIATMRNWPNMDAFAIGRFLFYYRMVGVLLFELGGAEHRWLLLLFPNTFEYFFIALQAIELRWRTVTISRRFWLLAAGGIWVFIKLPQEWWIHVAQLDFTDAVRDHPVFGVAVVLFLVAVAAFGWFWVRPRLPPGDHPIEWVAPDPPRRLDHNEVRRRLRVRRGRMFDPLQLEKVALVAIVCTIFAQILPGADATPVQITVAVAVLATLDCAVGPALARIGRGLDAAWFSFLALVAVNVVFVVALRLLLPGVEGNGTRGTTTFFLLLLTLIVTLLDRYAPVHSIRAREWVTTSSLGRRAHLA